ncbi:hypothetical protein HYALB_00010754 [Hymenoscyphus albidus]|uniref:Carboxylic ester hydrolase n=1 Tax=Hymenoscyphus albidus TaxID=595503 RepID=A0A9N9LJ28_9HELO|nr:hypothetical protein HYALB_00010754 [Hymenoscyphus albidus]
MKFIFTLLVALPAVLTAPVLTGPVERAEVPVGPTVTITSPPATIIGKVSLTEGTEKFQGIPFAQPPVGELRLKPPQRLNGSSLGTVIAQDNSPACPQMFFTTDTSNLPAGILGVLLNTPLFQTITNAGEDCLYIDVFRPVGTTADAKLPVIFWIFGGGFELGGTAMYDGTSLVDESVAIGKPIIFVAVNYRTGGFGFMPGKEIMEEGSGNLGLLDQRMGLEWVADNIASFGGDPSKVTLWGESAGAISVMDQMVLFSGDHTYKQKPLFRAAIMSSGTLVPADPLDCPKGQNIYDTVVRTSGCDSSADTLACLRGLPYNDFLNAANSVPGILGYNSVSLSYLPRPDGIVLTKSPETLIAEKKFAKVPFIVGDQEDEGTIFALFQSNISTTAQVVNYLTSIFFHSASTEQMTSIVNTYQDQGSENGSPFGTFSFNNWYGQYKRMAAILGDLTFTLTRRLFLNGIGTEVKSWSYLSSYAFGTPFLGTFHASDLITVFYGILPNYATHAIRSYYFSFAYSMDPNADSDYPEWPEWSKKKELMHFENDSGVPMADDFRADSYDMIESLVDVLRL